jgi:integrase
MILPRGYDKISRPNKDGTTRMRIRARVYKCATDGQRKRVSVYGDSVIAVKAKVAKLEGRKIASFTAEKETLTAYLTRWLEIVKESSAPRTHQLYDSLFKKHIRSQIGALRIGKIRPTDVAKLFSEQLKSVGSRTKQLVYRVLHFAFDTAVLDGVLSSNPCLKQFKPKHRSAEFRSLSRDEARHLLNVAKTGDNYVLFYLALTTGMRQGELFGLRWDSVNLNIGFLSVSGTLTKDSDGKLTLRPPKGNRNRRIDLSPLTVGILREHRSRQKRLTPWVFADTNGNPMRKDNFGHRVFRPLLEAAKLGKLRFHDLRHTAATLMLEGGENVKVVQERLGHASGKMTLDVYAKVVPGLQRETAVRMDSILSVDGDTRWGHAENQAS